MSKFTGVISRTVESSAFKITSLKEEKFKRFEIDGVEQTFDYMNRKSIQNKQYMLFEITAKSLQFSKFLHDFKKTLMIDYGELLKKIGAEYEKIYNNMSVFERTHKVRIDTKGKILMKCEKEINSMLKGLIAEENEVNELFGDIFENQLKLGTCLDDAIVKKFRALIRMERYFLKKMARKL